MSKLASQHEGRLRVSIVMIVCFKSTFPHRVFCLVPYDSEVATRFATLPANAALECGKRTDARFRLGGTLNSTR